MGALVASAAEIEWMIGVMYPASSSAYLIMNVPPPPLPLPPGYALVGAINADPQQAAHLMVQADPDQQRLANEMVAESSIFGLVAWNAAEQTALVALRGTATLHDWLDDVDAIPVPFFACAGAGMVHMGFQLVYEHIRSAIQALLNAGCAGAKRTVVTGHSLGGAMAALCALDLAENWRMGAAPEVHTFAAPRTGDDEFKASFEARVGTCWRAVNFMDVVPQVPLPPVYWHVGTEILVQGGFRPLDVTYAHHLTTYLAGLKKLTAG